MNVKAIYGTYVSMHGLNATLTNGYDKDLLFHTAINPIEYKSKFKQLIGKEINFTEIKENIYKIELGKNESV